MSTSSLLAVTYYYGGGNPITTAFSFGFLAIGVAASIFVIVDASRRPDSQWLAAGQQKSLWIGLGVGGIVLSCCCGILGGAVGLIYFLVIRPKLDAAGTGTPFGGGFAPPPGPGGFPPPGGFSPPPAGFNPPPPPGGFAPPPPPADGGWPPPPPPPPPVG